MLSLGKNPIDSLYGLCYMYGICFTVMSMIQIMTWGGNV